MIKWIKYDPENPPKNNVKYLVSDGADTAMGYFTKYGDECDWHTDDCGSFFGTEVTHYAPISLPESEE